MPRIRLLSILNWIAFIVTLSINALSNVPGYFALTSQQAGESRAIFFLPAGYVFAIWGVIYLGLGTYLTYQARPVNRDNPIQDQIGWWFIVSCLGNIGWLVCFLNNQTWLSVIPILVLLFSLLMIYTRLGIGRKQVSTLEKWAVHIPFSIYLGWVSVANVANLSAALHSSGNVTSFLGIGADIWTVIMMAVAGVLALAMIFTRRDIAYALVVIWALIGIYARPFDTPLYDVLDALNAGLVHTAALVISIIIALAIVGGLVMRRPASSSTPQPQSARA